VMQLVDIRFAKNRSCWFGANRLHHFFLARVVNLG